VATNFPGSVDDASTVGDDSHPSADELLSSTDGGPAHHALHQNVGLAINAIEDKVGTGASTPVAGSVLTGTGSGTSGWSTDPLYVDETNSRVGIGTTSPGSELEVHGSSNPEVRIRSTDASDPALVFGDAVDAARASVYYDTSEDRLIFRGYDNANRMTITSSGNVGIGTTNPAQALEVDGQVVIGAGDDITPDGTGNGHLKIDGNAYSSFFTMDGTGTWIGNNSNGRAMILATDETARLTVGGTGLVGIGTTSPVVDLEVSSATGTTPTSPTEVRISTSTSGGSWSTTAPWGQLSFYSADSSNGGAKVQAAVATTPVESFGGLGRLGFWTHDGTSLNERMVVTNAGNVGIGTTSPQTALEIENGIITSRSTAGGTNTVGTDKGIALVAGEMNTTSQFTPGLLFGSTDAAFTTTNPKYNAGIFGRADETYGSDTDGGMSIQMRFNGLNSGAGHGVTGSYGYAFGATVLHSTVDNVSSLGLSSRRFDDAYVTNGVTTGSDERDKTNITDLDLGLEFVDSLRPVSWTWNDRSGYVGTRKHMGFVAQEIAATLGDDASDRGVWIHTESTEEIDEEGNTVTTLDRQGLRYSELMAPMVKAIQELSTRVTALEAA